MSHFSRGTRPIFDAGGIHGKYRLKSHRYLLCAVPGLLTAADGLRLRHPAIRPMAMAASSGRQQRTHYAFPLTIHSFLTDIAKKSQNRQQIIGCIGCGAGSQS
jgi:hypothetical protein